MKYCFLLLIAFPSFFVSAQYGSGQKEIDSLLHALNNSPRDSSRSPILVNLWRAHIDSDIEKAFDFSEQLIQLGNELDNNAIRHTGLQRTGIAHHYMDRLDSSNYYYKKALELSILADQYSSTAAMQLNIALNYTKLSVYDSSFYYCELASKNFLKENDSIGLADTHSAISSIYFGKGYYRLSLENKLKAVKIYEAYSDSIGISDTRSSIALTYIKMKDSVSAQKNYEEAITIYRKKNDMRYLALNLIRLSAILLNKKSTTPQAYQMLMESLKIAKEIPSPTNLSSAYYGLGTYYKKQNDLEQAKKYYGQSLKIADSIGQVWSATHSLLDLADIALEENDLDKAKNHSEAALKNAKEKGFLEQQQKGYLLLSKIAENKGAYNESVAFYKWHKTIHDSIYNIENGQRLSELQTIYETEKKEAEIVLQEKEIETLNQEVEIGNLRKGLYAGGMASALALSGLLVFGFRQRMRKNRIEREKQEDIYKQEIAHKKKELTSQTLHLVQKNTFIQELKENLESLKGSPEKFKMEFRRIVMLLKKENASDKDWEVFKTYFSEVHNDFDQKLRTLSGDISEKEVRLAAFLRMNLTTKEIAATLNVMPDSILKSKYRLKKKLGLDKEQDLNQFLNML